MRISSFPLYFFWWIEAERWKSITHTHCFPKSLPPRPFWQAGFWEKVHFPTCALFVCFSLPNPNPFCQSIFNLAFRPAAPRLYVFFVYFYWQAGGWAKGMPKQSAFTAQMLRRWACRVILPAPPDLHTFSAIFFGFSTSGAPQINLRPIKGFEL